MARDAAKSGRGLAAPRSGSAGVAAAPGGSRRRQPTSPARISSVESRRLSDLSLRLTRAIPHPHVELTFHDPWQLLVAVILSAQSTDRRVNLVTPELFARWPSPAALAEAPAEEVEQMIRSTGFFRNKTKSIQGASRAVVERFAGAVPRTMAELLTLPGVARKTANVVLGTAFRSSEGIAVDTHAMRVAQRLRLTSHSTPDKIEADLCRLLPKKSWTLMGRRLVLHGRYVCVARAPRCTQCALNERCPARQARAEGSWEERARREAREMAVRARAFQRETLGETRGTRRGGTGFSH